LVTGGRLTKLVLVRDDCLLLDVAASNEGEWHGHQHAMKRFGAAALFVTMFVPSALAQERPARQWSEAYHSKPKFLIVSDRVLRESGDRLERAAKDQTGRDSLRNGAILGAVLGAAGAAAFGAYLCNAVGEEGDPPCWKGVMVLGALGGGAGAAIGAGVDALRSRTPQLVVGMRF
jgi:hypothetical protein